MARVRVFPAVLLLVLLLIATGEMMGTTKVADARTCESQSHRFKGTCLRETNCANICKTEGFHGGDCRGLTRRCYCTRPC